MRERFDSTVRGKLVIQLGTGSPRLGGRQTGGRNDSRQAKHCPGGSAVSLDRSPWMCELLLASFDIHQRQSCGWRCVDGLKLMTGSADGERLRSLGREATAGLRR